MRLYPLRILGVALVGGPEIEERRTSAADGSNQAFSRPGDQDVERARQRLRADEGARGDVAQYLLIAASIRD